MNDGKITLKIHYEIYRAILENNIETVDSIVKKNPEIINSKDNNNFVFPLLLAIIHQKNDIARYLIDNGADLDYIDANGTDILVYCIAYSPEIFLYIEQIKKQCFINYNCYYFKDFLSKTTPELFCHISDKIPITIKLYTDVLEKSLNCKNEQLANFIIDKHLYDITNPNLLISSLTNLLYDISWKLINNGANIYYISGDKNMLCYAAKSGFFDICEYLINHGVDFNSPFSSNLLINAFSSQNDNTKQFTLLKSLGLNIKEIITSKNRLLCIALIGGNLENIKFALSFSDDLDHSDYKYGLPIFIAAKSCSLNVIKFLIDNGACLELENSYQQNIFHFAAQNSLEVFQFIYELKLNISIVSEDKSQYSPFIYAIKKNKLDIAKFILNHSDKNSLYKGISLLRISFYSQSLEMTNFILDNFDYSNKDKSIYLNNALAYGNFDQLYCILSKCTSIPNDFIPNLFHFLMRGTTLSTFLFPKFNNKFINTVYENQPFLIYLADRGNASSIVTLIQNGWDANVCDKNFSSLLMHVCEKIADCPDLIDFLIKNGAQINMVDIHYKTLLHYAAKSNGSKNFEYLLQYDFNINALDSEDKTPLYYASINGSVTLISLIISHGGNINENTNDEYFIKTMKLNNASALNYLIQHNIISSNKISYKSNSFSYDTENILYKYDVLQKSHGNIIKLPSLNIRKG